MTQTSDSRPRSFRDDWFVKGPQMVCGYCHGAVVQDKETKQWVHVRWRKDAFGWWAVLQNKRHDVTKAIPKPTSALVDALGLVGAPYAINQYGRLACPCSARLKIEGDDNHVYVCKNGHRWAELLNSWLQLASVKEGGRQADLQRRGLLA